MRQSLRNGEVLTATVKREHIIAYLTGRGEAECIILPSNVPKGSYKSLQLNDLRILED